MRRIWLGRMVPAAMVDATRRMSAQFLSISSAFTLPPTSGRPGFGSVAGVDQVEGFAAAGGREELAVARGGPTRTPGGRHRQGGLGLDDHGQRPVVRFAFDVPARDAHQFPEPVRGRGFGHLAQAEIDALGEQHVEQADAVATGRPGFAGAAANLGIKQGELREQGEKVLAS